MLVIRFISAKINKKFECNKFFQQFHQRDKKKILLGSIFFVILHPICVYMRAIIIFNNIMSNCIN